jgi:hypothetical protein
LAASRLSSNVRDSLPVANLKTRTFLSVEIVTNFDPSGATSSDPASVLARASVNRSVSSFEENCTSPVGKLRSSGDQ